MAKPLTFEQFTAARLETLAEYQQSIDVAESDFDSDEVQQLYRAYCNIMYKSYLQGFKKSNPTHAF